jgi:hypothetical protein
MAAYDVGSVELYALAAGVVGVLIVARYASQIRDGTKQLLGLEFTASVPQEKGASSARFTVRPLIGYSGGDANFVFPRFDPVKDRLSDMPPVPYRPFRWGPFQCASSLHALEPRS